MHFNKKSELTIQPFSDIHSYDGSYMPPITNADIIVCAGDIDLGTNTGDWIKRVEDTHQKPIISALGNHDFWNTSFADKSIDEWVEYYRSLNTEKTSFMQNETREINGIVFIVSTLWTDFDKMNNLTIATSKISKDFTKIRKTNQNNITQNEMYELYQESRTFIINELEKNKDKKCVVVTHYPPSISCNVSYRITAVSYYWVGFMEDIISRYQPVAYISGHMHNFYNEKFGETNVIINPAGKVINGISQESSFKDGFVFNV